MPAIFREVMVLRFQEQMKLEEIAQLARIPVATVKTRLYRGVMALRPALERSRPMTSHEHERATDLIVPPRMWMALPPTDMHLAGVALVAVP